MQLKDFQDLKFKTLKHFWGFDTFRDRQEEIIDSIINGKDTLALLPTGGGKSMCYQLPALLLEGTAIVISPLLALIRDQVTQLKFAGIEAEFISSEQEDAETEKIYTRCKEGLTKILYVSPERLENPFFLQNLQEMKISFIAVDEAHCISEWGSDFRPSYQNIKKFREQNIPHAPCLALTATATPKVLAEISGKLGLKNPNIFQKSFRRKNIKINVLETSDKLQWLLDFLRNIKSAGIIYAQTRRETEQITDFLRRNSINNVDFFHAGLDARTKIEKQNLWLKSNDSVLVATNAFGMGIDKDDVRFVIHFSVPPSVENYYQEIGRAGRDCRDSLAVLLWSAQDIDASNKLFLAQMPSVQEFIAVTDYLYSLFQIAEGDLPQETFQVETEKISRLAKVNAAKVKNILNFLHNQEIIYFKNIKANSSVKLKIPHSEIELLSKKDAYLLELMLRKLSGFTSQKKYFSEVAISESFGFNPQILRDRLKELHSQGIINYLDGSKASVKFLIPRDSRRMAGVFWPLFASIQQNKLQKWEEIKFYTQDNIHCKMRLILSYFGETKTENCKKCCVCERKNHAIFSNSIPMEILNILTEKPCSADDILVKLGTTSRDEILENLILLLDSGKIKMQDFRTYFLA